MKSAAYLFIIIAATILILIFGKSILIPIVFASLIWILSRGIRLSLDKIDFIKNSIPIWLKNVLIFILIILSFQIIFNIFSSSVNNLLDSYQEYQPNIQILSNEIGSFFNVNLKETLENTINGFDFSSILNSILNAFSGILSNSFLIIIYTLFLFSEGSSFKEKLEKIFIKKEQYIKIKNILHKIETSISNYFRLKAIVSLVTGTLSFLVLLLVGVDSPMFWALLIFVLNFIPTIGSLIATVFPAIFSLIQFGEFTPFFIVLISVGAVQVIVGNILEPRIMGKNLNLSPLVTLIALALWGKIWGITGMLLSVPITVIMLIVFSQFPNTKSIAIMLSENGEID